MDATVNKMNKWTKEIEDEIVLLIKDWLKQQGRTQADLRARLNAESSRMPSLMEVLSKEFRIGGMVKVVSILSTIEDNWANYGDKLSNQTKNLSSKNHIDPFDQLDLLMEEIREDCEQE